MSLMIARFNSRLASAKLGFVAANTGGSLVIR
jgi:hypothetical protein